jgi:integrase
LTDRFCQTAKPLTDGKQTDYFDSLTKGLCLTASASTRTFYLIYTKPGDGKRARMKLGRYPEMELATARERARETRAGLDNGKDPIIEKRAVAASQTVADLVDNYITRHAATKRTADAIGRRLRKNVKDVVGGVKLAELHRRDITRCIDAVTDRGAHVEANRVFEDLRAMLRWAKGRGDIDADLIGGMKKPTETAPRDRVLDAEEIAAFWNALPGADMRESTRRVLRLCLVTGQRVGEVSGMTRDEIDLDKAIWTIPAERAKNKTEHVVPLSEMALGIIRDQLADNAALAARKGREVPAWIFPGPGARAPVTGHAIAKALKREEAQDGTIFGLQAFTPHDLRRTMATHMEELGVSPFIIGHALNHVSITKASVTSRVYARYDYGREKREALELWAERLKGIIAGKDNVVAIRGAIA